MIQFKYTIHAGFTLIFPTMLIVNEAQGSLQVCIILHTLVPTLRDFIVSLATTDGTGILNTTAVTKLHVIVIAALVNTDYTRIASNVIFALGSIDGTQNCLDTAILDDTAWESTEVFTASLTTLDPDVRMRNNRATITIMDNES